MMTQTLDLELLVARVERLEQHNGRLRAECRWLKLGGTVLLVLAGGMVLLAAQSQPRAKVLEVEKFVLRDTKGNQRAVLAAEGDEAALTLYDAQGKMCLKAAAAEHRAWLNLYDEKGKMRLQLGADERGEGLGLYDDQGAIRAELSRLEEKPGAAERTGRTGLRILDPKEKPLLALYSNARGERLTALDAQGNTRMALVSANEGTVALSLFERQKPRTILGLTQHSPSLRLYDDRGTERALAGVAADGAAGFYLHDEQGKERVDLAYTRNEVSARVRRSRGEVSGTAEPERARPLSALL